MTIPADTYLAYMESYLETKKYKVQRSSNKAFKLVEKENGNTYQVNIKHKGKAFMIKLDARNHPLFNFLNDKGHEWSVKCDYVIFQSLHSAVKAYCIEMKNTPTNLPIKKIIPQLKAGVSWCRSFNSIIEHYKGIRKKRIAVKKYAFTTYSGTATDLFDRTGMYLNSDTSIRHCKIDEIEGSFIEDIQHDRVEHA